MIDCPEFLQNINFKINPINYRSLNLFHTKHSSKNYKRNSPSNILTFSLKMVYSLSCKYTLIILHLYQYAMITYIT